MKIVIQNIPKISFNTFVNWSWRKRKSFKDKLRIILKGAFKEQLSGGYTLDFVFYFKGKKLDTVNVFHYIKIFEDGIFKQDKDNGKISVEVFKGKSNYCEIKLTKINLI